MYISSEKDRMENDEEEQNIQDHLQDDVIKEALASGLDLREYSKKVRKQHEFLVSCTLRIDNS
jgi:hypothetical protein